MQQEQAWNGIAIANLCTLAPSFREVRISIGVGPPCDPFRACKIGERSTVTEAPSLAETS